MTTGRLEGLSFASLLDIAAKEGIAVLDGTDKDSLIEQIEEAMEEDRTEREQSNNPPMRIKEKTYDLTRNEEIVVGSESEYPLPDDYNETRIVALLRDPLWAFAYWDLKKSDRQALVEAPDFDGLFLRVCELTASSETEGVVDYFEIPVKLTDASWYINLPSPGKSYRIELHSRVGESDNLLCRSNTLHCSLGQAAVDYLHEMIDQTDNEALSLTGLNEFSGSVLRDDIPQRIISLIDSEYFQSRS